MRRPNVKSLTGNKPHPSWKGWRNFLKSCEKRDEYQGVIFYGQTNCNYILFPDGTLVQNYAFHGHNLMRQIRKEGTDKVKAELIALHEEINIMLRKLKKGIKQ